MSAKKIKHIFTDNIISVTPTTPMIEALKLMRTENISALLVLEHEKAVGIFTERDVVRCIAQQHNNLAEMSIGDVMTRNVLTTEVDATLFDAFQQLSSNKIRHLAVTDGSEKVVGIVTQSDMVMHLGYEYFVKVKNVSQMMSRDIITVGREKTVQDASCLMADQSVSFLVVEESRRPLGILTERDVTRLAAVNADLSQIRVEEAMNSPVITVSQHVPAHSAAEVMRDKGIRRLVIVDEDDLIVGVVTQTDMVRGMESKYIESLKTVIKEQNSELGKVIRQLSQKTLYLDSILNSSVDLGYVATNRNLEIVYYNPTAAEILGVAVDQVIGKSLREMQQSFRFTADDLENVLERVKKEQKFVFDFHPRMHAPNRSIQGRVSAIWDNKEIVGLVLMLTDVTAKRNAEAIEAQQKKELEQQKQQLQKELAKQKRTLHALRESEARFYGAFEYAAIGMALVAPNGSINKVNQSLCDILGYSREDLLQLTPGKFTHPEDVENDRELEEQVLLGEIRSYQIEKRYITKQGQVVCGHLTVSLVRDEYGTPSYFIMQIEDISARKKAEDTIRFYFQHDSLTGLPNRALFADRLQQAIFMAGREKRYLALLFVDLDHFKPINDNYGHAVGDILLEEVARRLQANVRESDTVARIGGDEFLVLLTSINREEDAMLVAEKIRQALDTPFIIAEKSLSISSSIGISTYPVHGLEANILIKNADIAMYKSKQDGRNTITLFQEGMEYGQA